ncbi:MAG TPA: NADH-quinone oxidoreductase subunit J [Isosphaeraceae bacterium]|jgi:NADH-quinone oxidoreductase subunit J|nr:NADH-quinone oxidoreductase subunit J [Isosphaeraceae bacterium]
MNLSSASLAVLVAIVVLGGTGISMLLPHRHGHLKPRAAHLVGAALAAIAGVLVLSRLTPVGPFLQGLFFYAFALASLAGGLLMVTSRNPIYGALWFAAVVLATTGLFLLAGAQFLAAGTVIVYAGAIIVTFLFVIMLAQAGGQAPYDRAARAPFRATFTGVLLFFGLLYALLFVQAPFGVTPRADMPPLVKAAEPVGPIDADTKAVLDRALTATARLGPEAPPAPGVPPPHVAGLGGTMFTDHLLSVEVAGVILFVALVGALAIATPRAPIRPETRVVA